MLSRAPSQHGNQREKEKGRCSCEHRAETVKREKAKEAGAHGSAGPNQRKVKAITPVLSRAPSTPSEQREKKTGRCSCEHRADTTKKTRAGARESTAPPPPNHNKRTIHPGTAQTQQERAEGKAMKRMNTGRPAHRTQTCECTGTNPHQPPGWGVHGHQEKVNRAQTTGAQRSSPTRDTRACNAPRPHAMPTHLRGVEQPRTQTEAHQEQKAQTPTHSAPRDTRARAFNASQQHATPTRRGGTKEPTRVGRARMTAHPKNTTLTQCAAQGHDASQQPTPRSRAARARHYAAPCTSIAPLRVELPDRTLTIDSNALVVQARIAMAVRMGVYRLEQGLKVENSRLINK